MIPEPFLLLHNVRNCREIAQWLRAEFHYSGEPLPDSPDAGFQVQRHAYRDQDDQVRLMRKAIVAPCWHDAPVANTRQGGTMAPMTPDGNSVQPQASLPQLCDMIARVISPQDVQEILKDALIQYNEHDEIEFIFLLVGPHAFEIRIDEPECRQLERAVITDCHRDGCDNSTRDELMAAFRTYGSRPLAFVGID